MWRWSTSGFRSHGLAAVSLCAVAAALVAAMPASAASSVRAPEVVVDTDMDFDDTAALAYLAEADRIGLIDLRAVTVALDGAAFPGNGLSHARCLLSKLGMSGVPSSDGDRLRTNNFPDFVRALLDGVVERAVQPDPATPCPPVPIEGGAASLLIRAIRAARRPVTLIALGPVTNLAQALERDPAIAPRIARVVAVGGDLTGLPSPNPLDTHDFNLWVDAPAAQAMLRAFPGRVFMSARSASDHVPLTAAFRQRLAAEGTTPAAGVFSAIASDPLIVTAEEGGTQGGGFWWDPLAAVAATVGGVERFELMRITILQSGADEGRTVVDPAGVPVHMGVWASAERFHDVVLDVLNDRVPDR